MAEIEIRHELDCSEDVYWEKCVFDREYNEELYSRYLKFPLYELVSQDDGPEKITRKVRIEPPVGNLPGPVKKVLGDRLGYVEEGTFDKKTRRYTFKVTPSTMAEKTKTTGELFTEPSKSGGASRCVRVARMRVEVKVFAIGGMVEDKIIHDLRSSYEAAAKFTNEWVKTKGL
jgi:hypothetical protein